MNRFFAMFELTAPEQRVVIVVLLGLVAFVALQNYRATRNEAKTIPPISAQPSPSPGTGP